jgi:translocation and assembly module TamB
LHRCGEGGYLQVHADGTATLEGRLNLNVVAKNGDVGLPTLRLGVIALRVPIAGPVPLVLLQEASNLLANRAIYLEVTGTARKPVVRVRPLALLSEEAVRFFLNRANLPVALAP